MSVEARYHDFISRMGTKLNPLNIGSMEPTSICTFDVETKDGLKAKELFCWYFAYRDKYSHKVDIKCGFDNLKPMFDYLLEWKSKEHWKIVYVHNLGFEARFLANYCKNNGLKYHVIAPAGNVIAFVMHKVRVRFQDTVQFLQCGQDKAEKEWEIDEDYTKIDCTDLFEKDYSLWNFSDKLRVLLHCQNDVRALRRIMVKFREEIHSVSGVDVCKVWSIGSLALKALRMKLTESINNPFVYKKISKKGRFTLDFTRKEHDFVRKTYFGGRCEVFDLNKHGKSLYVDKVSMYPAQMRYKMFPKGYPYWIDKRYNNHKKILENIIKSKGKWAKCEGFIHVKIKHIPENEKYPILPERLDNKVVFTQCPRERVYTVPELRYAYERGYEIEVIKGLIFMERFNPFVKFVDEMFEVKSVAKGGRRKGAKIILNGAYGKFGQHYEGKSNTFRYFSSTDSAIEYIVENNIEEYKMIEEQGTNKIYLIIPTEYTSIKTYMNVCIASYITAYARIDLTDCLNELEKLGIPVYYCDTDSFTIPNTDFERVKNESNIKVHRRLGGWDIEQIFDEVKFLAPKAYISIQDGKPKLKLKGVDRKKIEEIVESSSTLEEIEEKIREPIEMAERYNCFTEAHRFGLILSTKKPCKHYSYENLKRNFSEVKGTSVPFTLETLPANYTKENNIGAT